MAHISDIKLIRTDTTLDLSQKAEKDMKDFGDIMMKDRKMDEKAFPVEVKKKFGYRW
ncbi:unnamed protein product, partial [Sphenostylis stenocarpa]